MTRRTMRVLLWPFLVATAGILIAVGAHDQAETFLTYWWGER